MRRRQVACAAVIVSACVASCSPIVLTHGYTPRANELDDIQVGVDTRDSIQRKLGRPSTISAFDDADWYYVSIKTETVAFYAPEVIDQSVVAVSFNATGNVADVNRFGLEDGRVVDLVSRTTPTSGRQLTILQQIFANLGRFDSQNSTLGGGPIGGGVPGT